MMYIDWKDYPNFEEKEFSCPCCGLCQMDIYFLAKLQRVRVIYDNPITINSGYRCSVHNERVGGAEASQHVLGLAADLHLPICPELKYKLLNALFMVYMRRIFIYTTHFHVDMLVEPRYTLYT